MLKYMMKRTTYKSKKLFRYLERIGIALSVFLNVILGGSSNQTLSARQYQRKRDRKLNVVWLIDLIFFFDQDHCMMSWLFWNTHKNIRKAKNNYVQRTRDMVEYKYNDEGVFYEQPRQSNIDRLRRSLT
jgi:hypothetical protein